MAIDKRDVAEAAGQRAAAKRAARKLRPSMLVGWAGLAVAVGLTVTGALVYRTYAPHHIDLAALQWAGSSGAAVTAADGRVSGFRFALRWDLWALMPGYTLGLLTACYLGRRVFWTAGMYSLAKVGIGVSIAVGVLSAVQDLLLLAALRDGLHGNWIFRASEGLSLARFCGLLVAAFVAILALATTLGRLVLHLVVTPRRWKKALAKCPPTTKLPVVIPPPLINVRGGKKHPARADDGLCRCWIYWDPGWGTRPACCGRKGWKEGLDADGSRPALIHDGLCRCWWDSRSGGSAAHWDQGFASPQERESGRIGICVSGGGIRSASVSLGALQALREEGVLDGADYLASVSGGGYTTGMFQLAMMPFRGDSPDNGSKPVGKSAAKPGTIGALAGRSRRMTRSDQPAPSPPPPAEGLFAPGSPEEDHLRRHSSYIADGVGQWIRALAVLYRSVACSLVVIGLTITVLGLAIGRFYDLVPIVDNGKLSFLRPLFLVHVSGHHKSPTAPAFPAISPGIWLAVGCAALLTVLAYVGQLSVVPVTSAERYFSQVARVLLAATALLATIGVALPALIWVSSRVTWSLGFSPLRAGTIGSLSLIVTYLGTVAATLWRNRTTLAKSTRTTVGLTKGGPVNQVLPNSMLQLIIMWICLAFLILAALLLGAWVATSGLASSWWALLPAGALAALAILVDQTSLSLHPFYRRRLASAFAVRRVARCSGAIAEPYPYGEMTYLKDYAGRPDQNRYKFPAVTFCATANITGQDRTPPGRRAVSFTLAHDYIGGPQTGWVRTDFLEAVVGKRVHQDLTVEAAMAISGAAFASAMGSRTRFYEVFLALSNARLGAWLPNPYFVALKLQNLDNWTIPGLPQSRRLSYFAREVFGLHPSSGRMLLCTDGGHYDNLGLVEMLRRRCKRIYCIDASGAGPPLDDTLAAAIRLAREELGIEITLEDSPLDLVPGGRDALQPKDVLAELNKRLSKSAVTIGMITYPEVAGYPEEYGDLVFAQAVLTPNMPYQLLGFSQEDPTFPWDSTADLWFNSDQFDSYQQLGHIIGQAAVSREKLQSTGPTRDNNPPRSVRAGRERRQSRVGRKLPGLIRTGVGIRVLQLRRWRGSDVRRVGTAWRRRAGCRRAGNGRRRVRAGPSRPGRARSRCRAAMRRPPADRRQRRERMPGCALARQRPGRRRGSAGGRAGGSGRWVRRQGPVTSALEISSRNEMAAAGPLRPRACRQAGRPEQPAVQR